MELVPFVFTAQQNLERLRLEGLEPVTGRAPEIHLVDEASSADFGLLLNHTNQLAFGGETNMGMPLWVLLDCGVLPAAVVGLAAPRDQVDGELAARIGVDPGYEGLVPISEYCACPTLEPACVSGFSLQTQTPGRGIATRTKALALLVFGSRAQIGVTQFDNPAIRVHARFGPMRLTVHRPSVHTHARNSFAYRIELSGREDLMALARGSFEAVRHEVPSGQRWSFDPGREDDHARLREHVLAGDAVWVVAPGWRRQGQGCRLDLVIG